MAEGDLAARDAKVFDIVLAMLAKREFKGQLQPDQSLVDAGMTSLDMVTLMFAIESEFDVEIPQRQVTPDNFRSVRAIGRLLETLQPVA